MEIGVVWADRMRRINYGNSMYVGGWSDDKKKRTGWGLQTYSREAK